MSSRLLESSNHLTAIGQFRLAAPVSSDIPAAVAKLCGFYENLMKVSCE
jgi:hypothetical protein